MLILETSSPKMIAYRFIHPQIKGLFSPSLPPTSHNFNLYFRSISLRLSIGSRCMKVFHLYILGLCGSRPAEKVLVATTDTVGPGIEDAGSADTIPSKVGDGLAAASGRFISS